MHRIAVGLGIDRNRAQAHRVRRTDHAGCDLAAIGDQEGAKSPVLFGTIHHHILNRPNRVGSIGVLAAAERPRPSTSLVSAGSITPASPNPAGGGKGLPLGPKNPRRRAPKSFFPSTPPGPPLGPIFSRPD